MRPLCPHPPPKPTPSEFSNLSDIPSRTVSVPRLEELPSISILEAIKGIESSYINRSKNRVTDPPPCRSDTLNSSFSSCTASEMTSADTKSVVQSESLKLLAGQQRPAFPGLPQSGVPKENNSKLCGSRNLGTAAQAGRHPRTESLSNQACATNRGGRAVACDLVESDVRTDAGCDLHRLPPTGPRQQRVGAGQLPSIERPKYYSRNKGPRFSHLL